MKKIYSACSLAKVLVSSMSILLAACGGSGSGVDGNATAPKVHAQVVVVSGTATFSGPRNNYAITRSSTGFSVLDKTGVDGATNLAAVQALRFSDGTVNLNVASNATRLSAAEVKRLTELYIAFFNRVPDADGLNYWIGQFNAGLTLSQIAESFYAAAVRFSALTGYSATMGNDAFVRIIYKNVLGRTGPTAPPDADVAYWVGELASGRATKGTLVDTILNSAHTFLNDPTYGFVAQLLDNKYTVASYFAIEQGLNYKTPEESISKTIAIAAAVTPTNTSNATGLIGVTDSGFNLKQLISTEQSLFRQRSAGVWNVYDAGVLAPVVIRFDASGNYLIGEADNPSGLERGTITVDPVSKNFYAKILQDTNGNGGLSDRTADELAQTIGIEGADIVIRTSAGVEAYRFKRVANDNQGIVGAFAFDSPNGLATQHFIFSAEGRFMMIDPIGDNELNKPSCGGPGLEFGTYTYNRTSGTLTITGVNLDTNGCAGFNEPRGSLLFGGVRSVPVVLSLDGSIAAVNGQFQLRRISSN